MSYYEQSLARAHPIYLQQLGANTAQAKSGSDKALVYLTVVSMAVVVCLYRSLSVHDVQLTEP